MKLEIDEAETNHVYACLVNGNDKYLKAKKDLEKLGLDVKNVDEELAINAKLRREFNPRAEEEAREKARANDPAQMDLTETGSSGETGGGIPAGQTFSLKTPADMTNEELRDALLELGLAVQLDTIEAWVDEELEADVNAVESWIEAARTALANGDALPDEPMLLERDAMTVARLQELLAAGPYRVEPSNVDDMTVEYEVCRDSKESGTDAEYVHVDETLGNKLDAEIRAAGLNKTELQRADMSDDEITQWAERGPWKPSLLGEDGWFIVAGTQEEFCDSETEAIGRAARYNRSIAQRSDIEPGSDYEIVDPEPTSDTDQAKEIVAAGRAD